MRDRGRGALVGGYGVGPGIARVVTSGVPSVLMVGGALALERRGAILRAYPVQLLGGASYALYLVHPFPIEAGARTMGSAIVVAGWAGGLLVATILIAVVVAAAIILHLCFEKPVGRLLRGAVGHVPAVAVQKA